MIDLIRPQDVSVNEELTADGGEPSLRRGWLAGLAANPAAPPEVLGRLLAAHPLPDRGGWLAERPLPPAVLEAALAHPAAQVRRRLADNPHLTAEELARLAYDRDRLVRRACAVAAADRGVRLPVDALAALAGDRDTVNRCRALSCPGLPGGLLVRLARDAAPVVRAAAVTRRSWPLLPEEVRTALRADRDPAVRTAVLLARQTERPLPRTLAEYIAESDPRRRERAAAGAPIERRLGEWLLYDDDPWIRRAAAGNPHLPTDLALTLADDPAEQVRLAVSLRADLTEEQRAAIAIPSPDGPHPVLAWVAARHGDPVRMRALAGSAHPLVRRSVAAAPELPAEVAAALAEDPDPLVRIALAESCDRAPHGLLVELFAAGPEYDGLAGRPGFALAGLAGLAGDPQARRRLAALHDPLIASERVARLTGDPDPAVADAAVRHPRLPLPVLRHLLASEHAPSAAANPGLPVDVMHCLLDLSGAP
ncbi:hypothetical protein [Kitasatospora paracochleata]|uniref:Leucine rich repeat (LRR) protein n=1 Tax=Kitasatospora paracochleata TaxID=58354 RepID=A0ABT1IVD3_9ACTN|nr:hypothetical protein [Kitasatospora paracochleata]MCP2309100.1 hypothetical protein [Kitasatospora paracochleata]